MGSAMNMSNYEIEIDLMEEDEEYSDEIMCTGWNPDVDLVCQQLQLVSASEEVTTSAHNTTVISDLLLRRTYSYQY